MGESFDRVSSLHSVLRDVIDWGTEQDVITAFAEALLAWDGIEVRGYIEDCCGRYMLAVLTPGLDRRQTAQLPADLLPADAVFSKLGPDKAAPLALRSAGDVFAARIGSAEVLPWLIVLSGNIRAADEPRLSLYVDVLRDAVGRAASTAATRASRTILQHLLSGSGETEAAGLALRSLIDAAMAQDAALDVTLPHGAPLLSVGDRPPVADPASGLIDELTATIHAPGSHTVVLTVRRPLTRPFTRRDQQMVDRAAAVFSSWVAAALIRSAAETREGLGSGDLSGPPSSRPAAVHGKPEGGAHTRRRHGGAIQRELQRPEQQ